MLPAGWGAIYDLPFGGIHPAGSIEPQAL